MSAHDEDRDEAAQISDLLANLEAEADVLCIRDEAEDIALDLHEDPFSEAARRRAMAFLGSDRYTRAVAQFRTLQSTCAEPGGA